MKASVHLRYGPAEVQEIREVPRPVPGKHEVLIRVAATTVNRTDCGFRAPEYLIVRLIGGIFRPRNTILGTELSGVVVATGEDVTSFKTGDQVFGLNTYRFGAHAEYICIPESGSIALKPVNLSHSEAAGVCDGLMLAINYIRRIDFQKHPDILINGASGSIGSASVQLAKYYGGRITAVCGTKNIELVRSLGADEVLDYTKEDFTRCGRRFDVVLDAVGKSSFFRCRKLLKPGGVYYSTELGYLSQNVFLALFTPLFGGRKVKFPIPTDSQRDVQFFRELIETGHYRPVIDREYALDDIAEATRYVESGEKVGNVIIRVE